MVLQIVISAIFLTMATSTLGAPASATLSPQQKRVVQSARHLLENASITYIYGGTELGTPEACDACTQCLQPLPVNMKSEKKAKSCPVCHSCSLDCSHFTQLVYEQSGIHMPYITTTVMAESTAMDLGKRYGLAVISDRTEALASTRVGDLLVYKGHVVLVEKVRSFGHGDIIHATSGKDVKGAGQGIQRERFVDFSSYRGPLLRVLRPKELAANTVSVPTSSR